MSMILRQAASAARQASCKRTFMSSAVTRKDLVQDLYIREIKSYKPVAAAQDAHVGVVKKLATPTSPKAPALPTDLASELAAYDAAEPSVASAPVAEASSASAEAGAGGADAFLTFLEQDLPKPEAHH